MPFVNRMKPLETALGWIWFPVHTILLPLLLGVLAVFSPTEISGPALNMAYICISLAFLLAAMFSYFRESFHAFCDDPGRCVTSIVWAMAGTFGLNLAVSALFILLGDRADNPNSAAISALAEENRGVILAYAVFLAPIVEETLFRGVVFGALRPRSRALAYGVSAVLFSLEHLWQFVLAYSDPGLLLYAVQYLPVSLMLAWCYESSGSIWAPIFLHMGINALSFAAGG